MSEGFVGEIRMFAGSFAPVGWAFCSGQLMPISENEVLFNIIGTTYGGDGQSTFALPNLQSRIPIHQGQGPGLSNNYQIGEAGGTESVTLSTQQIPNHNHAVLTTATSQTLSPQDAYFATATSSQAGVTAYLAGAPAVPLVPSMVQPTGGSQPHENIQPTLCVSYIISLFGLFPNQN